MAFFFCQVSSSPVALASGSRELINATVMSNKSTERSTTYGGGGGGFVFNGMGFIVPTSIKTKHDKFVETWVRFEDGMEERLNFTNFDLVVREGHKISILAYNTAIWAIRNFATGQTQWFVDAKTLAKAKPQTTKMKYISFAIFILVFILISSIPEGTAKNGLFTAMFILGMIGGIISIKKYITKKKKYQELINQGNHILSTAIP